MKHLIVLVFLLGVAQSVVGQPKAVAQQAPAQYVCLPCGSDCDHEVFTAPGVCPHCHMRLVLKQSVVFQNITPAELCSIVAARPTVVLLDVRTPNEFNGLADEKFGHLKNAINIPVQELERRLGELEAYKNKEIIVYCSHNHRSPRASHILTEYGFTNVRNMTGGMATWAESVGSVPAAQALLIK